MKITEYTCDERGVFECYRKANGERLEKELFAFPVRVTAVSSETFGLVWSRRAGDLRSVDGIPFGVLSSSLRTAKMLLSRCITYGHLAGVVRYLKHEVEKRGGAR